MHQHDSRPFGILSNASLPIRFDDKYYPTIEHLLMSSLLEREEERAIVSSYPALYDARIVFNLFDEEQYLRIVGDACLKFYEKLVRKSSAFRQMLKTNDAFVCKNAVLLREIIGINDDHRGYNLLGNSLLQIKKVIEKWDDDYWIQFMPERETIRPIEKTRSYRPTRVAVEKRRADPEEREEYDPDFPEIVQNDEYDPDHPEILIDPFAPPKKRGQNVRWYFPPVGNYIDDLKFVDQPNILTDAAPVDPFDIVPSIVVDPLNIYKIFRVAVFLIDTIQNGMDILHFSSKSIDEILFENQICLEIFGGAIRPSLRREIYIETWDKYRAGTLHHYFFVHHEIIYPGNIVGFIRKYYIKDLNKTIGERIRQILFKTFLARVMEDYYPAVDRRMSELVIKREWESFTEREYQDISDRLYHLYFGGKFPLSARDAVALQTYEQQRRSLEEIEEALHFVPTVAPATDMSAFIHQEVKIGGRIFQNLYQWIYFLLFQSYGGIKANDAYPLTKKDTLQEHLDVLIQTRRQELLYKALRVKFRTYPQIQEILTYTDVMGMAIHFQDRLDAGTLWRTVMDTDIDAFSRRVMTIAVELIPKTTLHFEKTVFLYAFMTDFFRNLRIFKNIHGSRLDHRIFETFVHCFYRPLTYLPDHNVALPDDFASLVGSLRYVKDNVIADIQRFIGNYIWYFQKQDFVPSEWFATAKKEIATGGRLQDAANAFISIINCLYGNDDDISNDHLHLIAQILSGRDDLIAWSDPSRRYVVEKNMNPDPFEDLPKEIRDRMPKKKKKMKDVVVEQNLIHPDAQSIIKDIASELKRPSTNDPIVARASHAIANIAKYIKNPRRLQFFVQK